MPGLLTLIANPFQVVEMYSGDVLLILTVPAMLLCLACSWCKHRKEEEEATRQQNGLKGQTALM